MLTLYVGLIQPKSILASLQHSFLFPVQLNLFFSASSLLDTWRGPSFSWFPCHPAQQEWLCIFIHQKINCYTWKQVFLFKKKKNSKCVTSFCSGGHLCSSCRCTLEILCKIEYSQTNLASGKLLCLQIMNTSTGPKVWRCCHLSLFHSTIWVHIHLTYMLFQKEPAKQNNQRRKVEALTLPQPRVSCANTTVAILAESFIPMPHRPVQASSHVQ